MNLEKEIFATDYHYKPKSVNKFVVMVKFGKPDRRKRAFKNLIFRMMKDIVIKNVTNFLNLLNNTPQKEDLPERDEIVSECFLVLNKCIEKYKVLPSNNFYFYFNKALSRKFFKDYQRALINDKVEMTEAIQTCHLSLREEGQPDTVDILMNSLRFTDFEKLIVKSRMLGQKSSEFLKENEDISSNEYSKALKRIKEVLKHLQEKGEL